ncbi:erythromycin esterase family protein [Halovenus rubra]|uniref:Erythromycin esterase family protein n=2 Tax=Halovenus rubra TaxID=869890 RepID=A0ABD5XCI5_9EURY|nr:erythromycin esterase family protein [Halovenus rubra]
MTDNAPQDNSRIVPSTLSDDELAALEKHTIDLGGTNPTAEFEQASAISSLFADAQVIALGEATHGTREFFQLKHRFLRHLVCNHDVRVFAMEANAPETLAINEYVVHGRGDPKDALNGIYFWTWNVDSVLTMVNWLREFNQGRPLADRVRFYGFDAQYTTGAVAHLESYFDTVEASLPEDTYSALATLDDDGTNPDKDEQTERRISVTNRLIPELRNHLDTHRADYIEKEGERAFELARHQLTILKQAAEYRRARKQYDGNPEDGLTAEQTTAMEELLRVRDQAMADNVDWLLEFEDADKIVLWAHDAHINRQKHVVRGTDAEGVPMGKILADRYGDEYVSVGFSFGRGSFQAISQANERDDESTYELRGQTVQSPVSGTVDAALNQLDIDTTLVDIESAQDDNRLESYLNEPQPHFSVGAMYNSGSPGEYLTEYVYTEAFDAVCFVDETTRARPVDGDVPE